MSTVLVALAAAPTAAAVEGFEIPIPITTIVRAPEGSVTELESRAVPEQFVGQSCGAVAVSANQDSVHPGNDLVISSNGSSVTLLNVEGESGGNVEASGRLVLGSQILVSLVMGEDEVFSAGMNVVIDCAALETTTTTIPDEVSPTVVTTVPPEVLPEVVTTVPTEVAPTEALPSTLPFTGAESDELALIALALFGTGVLFLVATRSRRED